MATKLITSKKAADTHRDYEFKWRPAETRQFRKGGFSVILITPQQIIPFLYE